MLDKIMSPKVIGAVIGLVIGIVAVTAGAWAAFVVILFMLVGWFIAKFWMGEIDFVDSYERFLENRGRR